MDQDARDGCINNYLLIVFGSPRDWGSQGHEAIMKGYETKKGRIILAPNLIKKTITINGQSGEILSTSEGQQERLHQAQEKRAERFGLKVRKL